ncbi:MAG: cobaltochelatase subunit CobN, partial [Nitrososphaerota archaeon]|nr:cobaltochelatase subunit CobN [Nitrososphaerota archaeon]
MKTLKVAFATTIPTDAIPAISAVNAINEKIPNAIELCLRTGGDFRDFGSFTDFINAAKNSHVVIAHLMGDLPDIDKLAEALKPLRVPLMVSAPFFGGNNQTKFTTVEAEDKQKIFFYLYYGGTKNFENLMYYLANRFIGADYTFEAPTRPSWEGIYHPAFDAVPSLSEYLEKRVDSNRLTVGLWFHQTHWQGGDTDFINDVINEIEAQGVNVLPVFFSGSKNPKLGMNGLDWVIDNYFLKDGKPIVDVIVSIFSFSFSTCLSGVDATNTLKRLGVPIIKAITTCNTFEEWRDTMQGL